MKQEKLREIEKLQRLLIGHGARLSRAAAPADCTEREKDHSCERSLIHMHTRVYTSRPRRARAYSADASLCCISLLKLWPGRLYCIVPLSLSLSHTHCSTKLYLSLSRSLLPAGKIARARVFFFPPPPPASPSSSSVEGKRGSALERQ